MFLAETLFSALLYLSLLAWVVLWGFHLLGQYTISALSRNNKYRHQRNHQYSRTVPPNLSDKSINSGGLNEAIGVTIIRPLSGIDSNLEKNLASSFEQDYPLVQLLFVSEDKADPALKIVQKLSQRYPAADVQVLVAERTLPNPKVSNMLPCFTAAKYNMIWVCDSNVYTTADTLSLAVAEFAADPNAGAVHHLIWVSSYNTLGGLVEASFINSTHARMYLALNFIAVASCMMGKSNIYKKSAIDSCGGIAFFGGYMAEDNIIGQHIWNQGLSHKLTPRLAFTSVNGLSFSDYLSRRIRWIRTRKYNVTAATLIEPFTESLLLGFIASLALHKLFEFHPLSTFALHMLAWYIFDLTFFLRQSALLANSFRPDPLGFTLGWVLRELFALPIWLYAILGSQVSWRDRSYKLNYDGTIASFSL